MISLSSVPLLLIATSSKNRSLLEHPIFKSNTVLCDQKQESFERKKLKTVCKNHAYSSDYRTVPLGQSYKQQDNDRFRRKWLVARSAPIERDYGLPDPSALKLLTEDFRVLARVTNAITLHAAAIQRKIKVEDVLSELFEVDPGPFFRMINISVANSINETLRMREAFSKFASLPRTGIFTQTARNFFSALSYFLRLPARTEQLKKAANASSDRLLKASRKIQDLPETNCSLLDVENLKKFNLFFGDETIEFVMPNNSEISETLKTFSEQQPKILSCLKELPMLEEQLKNMSILGAYKEYKKLKRERSTVLEFSVVSKTAENFKNLTSDLANGLKSTRSVWGGPSATAKEMFNLMSQQNDSVVETIFYINDYSDMEFSITAGFRESKDLLKVFEDLKSPWFREKVARGASTEKLAKALEPYSKICKVILALETSWNAWMKTSEDVISSTMINGVATMKRIKWFNINSEKVLASINRLNANVTECRNDSKPGIISDAMYTFESEQLPAEKVALQFKKVAKLVSKLRSTSTRSSYAYETRIQYATQIGRMIKDIVAGADPNNATRTMQLIEVKIESHGPDSDRYFDLIERLAKVSEALNLMKELSKQVPKTNPTVSLGKIIEESNILKVAECMRPLRNDLHDTLDGLKMYYEIMDFRNEGVMDNTLMFLGELAKVQRSLHAVSTLVLEIRESNKKAGAKDGGLLQLKNPRHLTENLGQSIKILEDLEAARENRTEFESNSEFSPDVMLVIADEGLSEWKRPAERFRQLLDDADMLAEVARRIKKNASLVEMTEIFEKATKFQGIPGTREQLNNVYEVLSRTLGTEEPEAVEFFQMARDLDLDFAKHNIRLKTVRVTVTTLQQYFDEIFGHVKPKTITVMKTKHIKPAVSWVLILCLSIGFVVFLIVGSFVIYGFTENGRAWYKNIYLYWFGTPEEFEKRWRYSGKFQSFLDTVDGKNSLLDAVREGNRTSLLKALKNGAYVDVYNKFGNTALHVATKFAQPDHVELLIKYGADRSLLNYKNLTPMQYIPHDFEKKFPERVEKYEKIRKIYEKYEKKGFRSSVPHAFPDSSFHIWMDDSTDEKLCNKFMDRFRSITSDEAMPTTTHCVVKVDSQGILETDRLDLLLWLFHGVIIVKEQWMTDCLLNEKLIEKDFDYLVEKVRFNGVVYSTILSWSEAMAKGTMPFLLGAFVAVVAKDYKNLLTLSTIVTTQGGVMMNQFPLKQHFSRNSHPYLHAHLGPLFLIHDGTQDLSVYKNDPDKMYTLFTEEEFIVFMLRRETNRDTREHPVPVMIGDE